MSLDFWRGWAVGGVIFFVIATLLNCGARPECLYGAVK